MTPPAPSPTVEPAPPPSAPIIEEPLIEEPPPAAAAPELVSFTVKEEEATQKAWAGEEQTPAAPAVADTPVGASGTVDGVTDDDAAEAALSPLPLVAVTVKV